VARHLSNTWTAFAAAAAVVAFSAGCSATPAPGTPGSPATGPTGSPYDVLLGDKVGLIDYAEQRLRNACMTAAGYPQNQQAALGSKPGSLFGDLAITAATFGSATEDDARRLGFGADDPGEPARIISFDPNYDTALDRCERAAYDKVGAAAQKTLTSYNDLLNQLMAYRGQVTDQLPKDNPAKTLTCMDGKGFHIPDRDAFLAHPGPDLYGVQGGVLDPAPETTWEPRHVPGTVQVGPAIPARKYHPSSQESALAVAWYQCGNETGRVPQEITIARALQQQYVDKYQTQIEELNPKIEALARSAATLAGN